MTPTQLQMLQSDLEIVRARIRDIQAQGNVSLVKKLTRKRKFLEDKILHTKVLANA